MGAKSKFGAEISKASTDYDTVSKEYETVMNNANATEAEKAAVTEKLKQARLKGDTMTNNLGFINMQIQKDPNFDFSNLTLEEDLFSKFNPNGPTAKAKPAIKFHKSVKSNASGGKLTAEQKLTIEGYKALTKSFSETAKDYNKWLASKIKQDNKELSDSAKNLNNMLKGIFKD